MRIVRIKQRSDGNLLNVLLERIGNAVSEDEAIGVIRQLLTSEMITEREAKLMKAAVGRNALALPVSAKDVLRASVLREMLVQVFRNYEEAKRNGAV